MAYSSSQIVPKFVQIIKISQRCPNRDYSQCIVNAFLKFDIRELFSFIQYSSGAVGKTGMIVFLKENLM
jgi:hypothetical protein